MFDLKKLEAISKIELTDEEKNMAFEFFGFWIEKFDTLAEENTEDTEPLVSVLPLENVMREDVAYKAISRDELLENAPGQHDGYFVVPKILD